MSGAVSDSAPHREASANAPATGGASAQQPAIRTVKLSELQPAPWNARRVFDEEGLQGLASSLKKDGQLQPIVVRPLTGNGEARYEIIAGERRYRAAALAGMTELIATVQDVGDDVARVRSLSENLGRENLNEWEELQGMLELLSRELSRFTGWPDIVEEQGGAINAAAWVVTQSRYHPQPAPNVLAALEIENPNELTDVISDVFEEGRSIKFSTFRVKRVPMLTWPADVQQGLAEGRITMQQSRVLQRIENGALRSELINRAAAEKLSAKDLSTLVREAKGKEEVELTFADAMTKRVTDIRVAMRRVDELPARDKQRLEKAVQTLEALLMPAEDTAE